MQIRGLVSRNPSERGALLPDRPSADALAERRKRSTIRVLLVDDAPDARLMYGRYLQFRGLQVETASDGMEALEFIDSSSPDAIVLDLAMPRITGWDVIRELKANPRTRNIPVIALSGHDAQDSALKAGADTYCSKPCGPEDLLRAILTLLRWEPATNQ